MADIPSRGLSLKAFDDLNLVRLNNELKRIWTALETLNTAQPTPAYVSTEPESDQGYQYYETPPVVTPDPTDPVPDDDPGEKADPLSMAGYSPTATEDPDGKHVILSWSDWVGVDNPAVKGYYIYYSSTIPTPITRANRQRKVDGSFTNVTLKMNISRNVNIDYRVQPYGKDERGKIIEGVASD